MVKEVKWSKKAKKSYKNILDYLTSAWSLRVAEDFDEKLDRKLLILKMFPHVGINSLTKKGYKRFVLSHHNSIIYRVKNNRIIILNVHDNRQNPRKSKF
jgi:plasmid stabilization system protein ParE